MMSEVGTVVGQVAAVVAFGAICGAWVSSANAADRGVTATRLYYQVNQPMEVGVAAGAKRELVLLTPRNEEVARAAVPEEEDVVDAAALFPGIFDRTTVHYLQLFVDGNPTGAALVLQPLVNEPKPILRYEERGGARVPVVAGWIPRTGKDDVAMAGFRVYAERNVVLHTTMGDITVALRPDQAPNTSYNFVHMVEGGFFRNTPVHRIVSSGRNGAPFVIQAGDPTGTGGGGPGYSIDLEATKIPHDLGVISMARETDINTAGSQFFLCLSRAATAHLDGQYASFGHTVAGIDVVTAMGKVPTDPQTQRPTTMPYISSTELVDAAARVPGVLPSWFAGAGGEGEKPAGAGAEEKPVER